MNVNIANKDNLDDIKDMWRYCFAESESYNEYYFNNKLKLEDTVVCCENNRAIASIQLNQFKIMLNGKEESVSYVVGVSTMPEARGKGVMKEMMKYSLNEMYKRGQKVSILMPIDFRLYRRYGYENCYDILEHHVDMEELSGFRILCNVRRMDKSDISEIEKIYNCANRMNNGYVKREKKRFENMFLEAKADGSNIYGFLDDNNNLEGYMVYSIDGGVFFAREFYFSDIRILKSMLAFIYNHNTQCKKAVIMDDIRNSVGKMLRNPRNTKTEIKQFMMGRVINFDKILDEIAGNLYDYEFDKYNNYSFIISVKDDYLENNNALYSINISNGCISYDKKEYSAESDVCFSINRISQLVFSYMDIDELDFAYDLNIDEKTKEIINKIFVKKRNHINEYD